MKIEVRNFDVKKILLVMFLSVCFVFIVIYSCTNKDSSMTTSINDVERVDGLVLNEIMSSNDGIYVDAEGNAYDWIELYNGSDRDINLEKYGLSDSLEDDVKWLFPNITIKSHEYLIVYLSSTEKEGLYANFSLKKEGKETLVLRSQNGEIIDSIETVSLDKNYVMIRNSDDKWETTELITPGYSNDEEGRNNYLKSLKLEYGDLEITEILANNQGNYILDGKLPSYVEITNNSDKEVDLKDYYLSNESDRPFYWNFPSTKLKPGEIYLVITDGANKENHASFNLDSKYGNVILSYKNKIVDEVTYEELPNGLAFIKENDTMIKSSYVSPGYVNDLKGKYSFEKNYTIPNDLIISEVMSSNNKYLPQNGGKYYDWIEFYNNTNNEITLSDYSISTNKNNDSLYRLPDVKLKSKQTYVLMASGNEEYSNKSYIHSNFKLSSNEGVFLFKGDKLIDSMFIYNIPKSYSYGVNLKGGRYYYSNPTPNQVNNKTGVLEIAYAPVFDKESGVYNNVTNFTISLSGGELIYYTLDGSIPTKKSKVYKGPIKLDKTTVIRAISYDKGKAQSEVVTKSYIINENHTLPVLSVSLPNSDFKKINNNITNNRAYKAYAELFENGKGFSSNCGLKIFGGDSRMLPKKSYALKFSLDYGDGNLNYKVFDDLDAHEFDALVLRSGSQEMNRSLIKDEVITTIIRRYGTIDAQANKPVVLYVNGGYHGIYFIREKINEEMIRHHYNITDENSNIVRIDQDITTGKNILRDLNKYVTTHDLGNDMYYQEVEKKLDIDNFIDLWIAQLYTGDYDVRNIRFFNNKNIDNGKIKMIGYDFDFAFYSYPSNYYTWMMNGGGMGYYKIDNKLLVNLMKNNKFKQRFVERLSYNLNKVWTTENTLNTFNEYYKLVYKEVKRDHKRWNFNYDNWLDNCDSIRAFLTNRRNRIIKQTKAYFGLSDKEVDKYFD